MFAASSSAELLDVCTLAALRALMVCHRRGLRLSRRRVRTAVGLAATWDQPRQWGLTGAKNWPTKYAAAGFIPRMIEHSPFVTADWRSASAAWSCCLRDSSQAARPSCSSSVCSASRREVLRSARTTARAAHLHSRGPCCLDGKYKDVDFLRHHVIGPHGEPTRRGSSAEGAAAHPLLRRGKRRRHPHAGPPLPRTARAAVPPPGSAPDGQRSLLLFYAGWNYGVRMELVDVPE